MGPASGYCFQVEGSLGDRDVTGLSARGAGLGRCYRLAASVAPIAAGRSDQFLNLTALLAMITGGLLALAGLARVGFIAEFLARHSVGAASL